MYKLNIMIRTLLMTLITLSCMSCGNDDDIKSVYNANAQGISITIGDPKLKIENAWLWIDDYNIYEEYYYIEELDILPTKIKGQYIRINEEKLYAWVSSVFNVSISSANDISSLRSPLNEQVQYVRSQLSKYEYMYLSEIKGVRGWITLFNRVGPNFD